MLKAHRHSLRVYVEDTDIGGIVYYANYLKFAERARTEMLRAANLSHAEMIREDDLFLAVKKCEIEYLKPAMLDDWLDIDTIVTSIGGARMAMAQEILCGQKKLAQLKVDIVCISKEGKPMRLPSSLMDILPFCNKTDVTQLR